METAISKLLEAIPGEVREYLSTGDGLGRAAVEQRHPQVKETLAADSTRASILAWLASDEAQAPPNAGFVTRCLQHLRPKAQADEGRVVRPFLLNGAATVRTPAYEFFLTLYFPDRNREALYMLLHAMLVDPDDAVRAQAARYVERAGAVEELRPFLLLWRARAYAWGWRETSANEIVERLLFESPALAPPIR